MKKRMAAGLTALAMIVSLAACGSASGSDTDTEGTEEETVEEVESSEEEIVEAVDETADEDETDDGDVITIKAVTSGITNPYSFVDENNEPTGYDVEVLKEIFNRIDGYELEIEIADFSAIFAGINSGVYQIAVNNFSYSEERAETYLYSYPYDAISYVFVTKEGNEISSFEEAAGLSVEGDASVALTLAVEDWNEENPDKAIDLIYTESETPVKLSHVDDGTVDFGMCDYAMFNAYMEEYGYDLVATLMDEETTNSIDSNTQAYFLFPFDETELRDMVNEVLLELKEDGTLSELGYEFFGYDSVPDDDQYEFTIN